MAGFVVASPPPVHPSSPSPPPDRHSKDTPVPLSLDSPAPSSPFPSPSSSFVPPPMPSAHEFAHKPPTARLGRRRKSSSPPNLLRGESTSSVPVPDIQEPTAKAEERRSPNGVVPSLNTDVQALNVSVTMTPSTPTLGLLSMTPTQSTSLPDAAPPKPPPDSTADRSTPTQTHITLPSPPASPTQIFNAPVLTAMRTLSGSGTASKHASLSSSRPAPASPAPSRRQSGVPSLRSRHRSGLSTASTSLKSSSPLQPAKRRGEIKIRDFAFPSVDARHAGHGPDTPKVIKRLLKHHGPDAGSRRTSGMSESSVDSEEGSSRRNSGFGGWGAFRWASKLGGSWGFGGGAAGSGSRMSATGGYTPSQLDFERNFDEVGDGEMVSSPGDADDGEYLSDYDNDDEGEGEGEGELHAGVYRALYDFEPEGTAEMGLKEGQTVRVVGRGGGVGWAIAVRPGTEGDGDAGEGNWALVPESYLRLVRVDHGELNGDEGMSLGDMEQAGECVG